MSEGWIKIYRSLADHWIYQNPKWAYAWLDLLIHANYKERRVLIKGKIYDLQPGQLAWSQHSLSKRWGVTRVIVRRLLGRLKSDLMIDLHSDEKTTVITVLNWATYQGNGATPIPTQLPTLYTTSDPRCSTDKKERKEEGEKRARDARPNSIEEVVEYMKQQNLDEEQATLEANKFWDRFTSSGWRLSAGRGGPMKDWRAAVRTWIRNIGAYGDKTVKKPSAGFAHGDSEKQRLRELEETLSRRQAGRSQRSGSD